MTHLPTSRRRFLGRAAMLAAAGSAGLARGPAPLALSLAGLAGLASRADAASGPYADYKALVCLFMNGGNDAHNWFVPTDADGHADYLRTRGALALPRDSLTAIDAGPRLEAGRMLGMPPELAPLRSLYQQGRAAVVANVGPLLRPTTKADYSAKLGLPAKLFSHNDQQSTWQSSLPEGARSGWGGRLADALVASNAQPVFTSVSATGNMVFLSGASVRQYQVGTSGSFTIKGVGDEWFMGSNTASAALRRILADGGASPFQQDYQRLVQRSIEADAALKAALVGVAALPIPATPYRQANGATATLDQDSLARQLAIVARLIAAQQVLGMRRQVFMVSIGGFDTHAQQLLNQAPLMARVALSIDYFQQALDAMGMGGRVTLFTASEFGRTLVSNGSGSDHGWGAHHLVVGGAVKGRELYGRFPVTALGTTDDVGSGRLLPSTSVDQVAATLGRWMGVSNGDLAVALPSLHNFAESDLGFMR